MFTMLVSIITTGFMYSCYAVMVGIIGIYIYRKSKQYRMNTLLWVIVGVVFNFVGLCAFLYARRGQFQDVCPVCFAGTPEGSEYCPECNARLEDVRPKMKPIPKAFIIICTIISFSMTLFSFFAISS
ncbi:MAG: hypothetical protein IJZ57_09905 [Clostridia bacterium]|nr:hypothetical protein [Clostridia bacterium]